MPSGFSRAATSATTFSNPSLPKSRCSLLLEDEPPSDAPATTAAAGRRYHSPSSREKPVKLSGGMPIMRSPSFFSASRRRRTISASALLAAGSLTALAQAGQHVPASPAAAVPAAAGHGLDP